eukprot:8343084-Alexandrium_andersonii.AAC.1
MLALGEAGARIARLALAPSITRVHAQCAQHVACPPCTYGATSACNARASACAWVVTGLETQNSELPALAHLVFWAGDSG